MSQSVLASPESSPSTAPTVAPRAVKSRRPGLWLLVRRSLRQHAVSTFVTSLSVALAAGLVMAVFAIKQQTHDAFTGGPVGFDAVLGARGSELQLVLNSVFHLETSPGNIPWAMYTTLKEDPQVELAVPYAVGDNYRGYRIVGTTDEMFTKFEYRKGKKFELEEGGRIFDSGRREAVIGSTVARRTGLQVGSVFNPSHGVSEAGSHEHADEYVVTGIMKPTNSPSDRVIWIPIEGIFRMEGHVLRGTGETYKPEAGQEIPDEAKEVSSVMLKFKSPMAGLRLRDQVNRQGTVATLAFPIANVMSGLFEKIGWVTRVLEMVAYLTMVVAAGSILASIYNTISERRREFAIMRALGARRGTVFSAVLLESTVIAFLGTLGGFLIYGGIVGTAALVIREQTGVVMEVLKFHPVLVFGPLGMIVLGALSGILPAVRAYSTDVASNLVPTT